MYHTAMATMLTLAERDAIARGMHPDPFAVLGPHDTAAGLAIRVFRPDVRTIELNEPGQSRHTAFERIHREGLFEVVIPSATRAAFDYRVRLLWSDGLSSEIDDPYRYGPYPDDGPYYPED